MDISISKECDFIFEQDEKLIIELQDSSIFEGNYSGGSNNRIDICNVLVYPKTTGTFTTIQSEVSLYKQEIVSIRRFRSNYKKSQESQNVFQIIPMMYDDFHSLFRYSLQYVYLSCVDAKYTRSIVHLRSKETLGVVGLGMETKGKVPIHYIVLSSVDKVFIYDLFLLDKQGLPREIKDLLESAEIQKVVHNSSIFVDYLHKCYKTQIYNIFDTAVADLVIQKQKTGKLLEKWRLLSECLSDYFNLPSTLVEDNTLNIDWNEQPLSEFCRIKAALLVGFLITFRNELEKIMLKKYFHRVHQYSNSLLDDCVSVS